MSIADVSAPTRPAAEPWVRPAAEGAFHRASQCLVERLLRVVLLTGKALNRLVAENLLKPVNYRDHVFFVRRLE